MAEVKQFKVSRRDAANAQSDAIVPSGDRFSGLAESPVPAQRVPVAIESHGVPQTRGEFSKQINEAWTQAQEKFLLIGRWLRQAKSRLKHGEYERMIAADLPFTKQVAHQLKSLADAVESGRFSERELPRSYSAGYLLATLSDAELERAKAEGLVSPDATRSRIADFRSRIRNDGPSIELETLRRRRERILAEAARLEELIAEMEGKTVTIEGTATKVSA